MLDGWFCRTMANSSTTAEQEPQTSSESSEEDESNQSLSRLNQKSVNHKAQYQNLKKKLKYLLYENEFFQDSLRQSQRRLLKVTRDRSFLLDRLNHYEKPEISSSESDNNTETSDEDDNSRNSIAKRRAESAASNHQNSVGKTPNQAKRKRPPQKKNISAGVQNIDGHMTVEERREVERHLQSRQSLMSEMDLPKMHVLPTVPTEMFSNDNSESNDQIIENSPSNDCLLSVHEIMQD